MPNTKMVTEETQALMLALYPKYQSLQRDGSVSMSANEAQQLLKIHKELFNGQLFCTTCPPAILKAVEMCFRDYEVEPKVSEDVERLVWRNSKKYVFAGTNKQRKKLKQVFGNDFTETVTGPIVIELKNMGYLNWFKEV
jgi:hypothetical protein